MTMIEAMWSGLAHLMQPYQFLMLFVGVVVGVIIGVIPAIGGTVGFTLLLPFVYHLDPTVAIACLIGMWAVTPAGDAISSILLSIPGGGASVATILDGHPMARKGEAARALSASFTSAILGGVIGAAILAASLPIARPLVLTFKSPEFLMLCLLGLSMVALLTGRSIAKGMISAGLGLMLVSIGTAPLAPIFRYNLGTVYLLSPVSLILVAMGLFGVAECIDFMVAGVPIAGTFRLGKGIKDGIRDAFKNFPLIFRCSLIGGWIGFLPGVGGATAAWLCYGHAVQSAKDKSGFGHGDVRGVMAPECANSAVRGGDLIPTLMFGVPGSAAMALFMVALMMFDITPGPDMVTKHLDITFSIIWSLVLANVLGTVMYFLFIKPLIRLTLIPMHVLAPFLLMVLILGAYQAGQSWGDLIVLLTLGIVGWLMKQFGFPRPPLLVAHVLGLISERYLGISLMRYGIAFLWRPGVIIIGLLTVASLWYAVRWQMSQRRKEAEPGLAGEGTKGTR